MLASPVYGSTPKPSPPQTTRQRRAIPWPSSQASQPRCVEESMSDPIVTLVICPGMFPA